MHSDKGIRKSKPRAQSLVTEWPKLDTYFIAFVFAPYVILETGRSAAVVVLCEYSPTQALLGNAHLMGNGDWAHQLFTNR